MRATRRLRERVDMEVSKKILIVLSCVALAAALALVGCASSSSSSSSSAASSSESASSAQKSSSSASASSAASSSSSSKSSAQEVQLQVFAANSLSKAMNEAQELYTKNNPEVTFADTQYEASGTLNEMLGAGDRADILITASKGTMDTAVENKYVDEATRKTMFLNDLVMVTAESSELQSIDFAQIATGEYTIAVGDDNVPAGNYANQSLSTIGCFVDPDGKTGAESAGKANGTDAYAGTPVEGKVLLGAKVGDVCKYAETGNAQVAFVYTSDVYRIGGVKIIGTVPNDTHKQIQYPGAVCANSENVEAAQAFLDWCMTDAEAQEIWQKWGFELA